MSSEAYTQCPKGHVWAGMDPTCRICDRCAAPDCGSVLNPKAPQYTNEAGENICPACYWKAVSA